MPNTPEPKNSVTQMPRIGAVTYAVGQKYQQLAEISIASLKLVGFTDPVEVLTSRKQGHHICTLKPHMILTIISNYDLLLCFDADVIFRSNVTTLLSRHDRMSFSRGRKVPGANTGLFVLPCHLHDQVRRWAEKSNRYGNRSYFDQGALNSLVARNQLEIDLWDCAVVTYPCYAETPNSQTVAEHFCNMPFEHRLRGMRESYAQLMTRTTHA